MEQEQRIIKAIAYLDNAMEQIATTPFKEFNKKRSFCFIKSAKTLLKNAKMDIRLNRIENQIDMIARVVLAKNGVENNEIRH